MTKQIEHFLPNFPIEGNNPFVALPTTLFSPTRVTYKDTLHVFKTLYVSHGKQWTTLISFFYTCNAMGKNPIFLEQKQHLNNFLIIA
jgi:hypothetical protein